MLILRNKVSHPQIAPWGKFLSCTLGKILRSGECYSGRIPEPAATGKRVYLGPFAKYHGRPLSHGVGQSDIWIKNVCSGGFFIWIWDLKNKRLCACGEALSWRPSTGPRENIRCWIIQNPLISKRIFSRKSGILIKIRRYFCRQATQLLWQRMRFCEWLIG